MASQQELERALLAAQAAGDEEAVAVLSEALAGAASATESAPTEGGKGVVAAPPPTDGAKLLGSRSKRSAKDLLVKPRKSAADTLGVSEAVKWRKGLPAEVRKLLDSLDVRLPTLRHATAMAQTTPSAFGTTSEIQDYLGGYKGPGGGAVLGAAIGAPAGPVGAAIGGAAGGIAGGVAGPVIGAIQKARRSPEETEARRGVFKDAYQVIHELAGAQLAEHEKLRLEAFLPGPNDPYETIMVKLEGALQEAEAQRRFLYETYGGMPPESDAEVTTDERGATGRY